MTYVVLQPHSNTNPSDYYRVSDSADWARFVNGEAAHVNYIGQFKDYADAGKCRDEFNGPGYGSGEFNRGYRLAATSPIEMILRYEPAADEFERGWNENIAERTKG